MAVTNVSMDPATRSRLKACALLRKQSMARVVHDAMAEFVARHGLLSGGDWKIRPDAEHAWCRATTEQAVQAREAGWLVLPLVKSVGDDDGEY